MRLLFILAAVFCIGCVGGRVDKLEREVLVFHERSVMLNNRLYVCEKRLSLAGKVCGERVSSVMSRLGVCEREKDLVLEEKGALEMSWRRCEREGVDLRKRFEEGCVR